MVILAITMGGIVILMLLFAVVVYNKLIGKKNAVEKSLKNIDSFLLKRYDLMNNLILQAERAMEHEETIYIRLAELRKGIQAAHNGNKGVAELDKALKQSVSGLNLIVEQYPQLNSINALTTGMDANIRLENEIAACRIQYNDNVELFRNAAEMFPNNILAAIFGFNPGKYIYIEVEETKKEPVVPLYADKIRQKYGMK